MKRGDEDVDERLRRAAMFEPATIERVRQRALSPPRRTSGARLAALRAVGCVPRCLVTPSFSRNG